MLLPNETRYDETVLRKLPLAELHEIVRRDSERLQLLQIAVAQAKKTISEEQMGSCTNSGLILARSSIITTYDVFQKEHARNVDILNERLEMHTESNVPAN